MSAEKVLAEQTVASTTDAMDDKAFRQWAELLEKRTGVVVPPARKSFMVTNLRIRMREIGCPSFDSYYSDLLAGAKGAVEWATLVDRLTVHETRFFRHQPSLDLVRQFLASQPAQSVEPFDAWSVGCSTGEEAYSLAMIIDAHLAGSGQERRFSVTATDVSQPALSFGRAATYGLHRLAEIPTLFRQLYCEKIDDRYFRISDKLRRRVGFALMNMLDIARAPLGRLNLVFCQNVLIYFPRDRRQTVLNDMANRLRPGGWLILGPGEVMTWEHEQMERVGGHRTLAWRRKA
ncbi:MAG: methyltransferase PilK [Lysobacteraceae bacterium]|nr:MAG: methyltransferase PilK [Xanthomonadaceae bacterium]